MLKILLSNCLVDHFASMKALTDLDIYTKSDNLQKKLGLDELSFCQTYWFLSFFGSFEICHQFKSLTVTLLRPSHSQYLHFIFDVKNFLWRKLWRVYLFATVKSKYFAKQLNRNILPALLSLWQKCHNGQFLVNVRPSANHYW